MAINARSLPDRGLTALFAEHGETLASVAVRVGVSPTLMQRIETNRQPMPLDLAETIGHVLGISSAEVLGAVSRATTLPGPRSHRPAPARPILGDAMPPVMYSATAHVEGLDLSDFLPTDFGGCVLWLRNDLGLTVTSDVKRWLDQSGFFLHFQEDAAANRPVLSGSALSFVRANAERLKRNAITSVGNGYTIGIALRYRSVEPTATAYNFVNGDGSANGVALRTVSGDRSQIHTAVATVSWGAATTSPETWVARHDGAGATADFALNGLHQTPQALANNVTPTTAASVGARFDGGLGGDVDVWAVIAYPDRKSDAIVDDMSAYLTALRDGAPLPSWRPTDESNLVLWLEQPEYYAGPAVSDWANQGTAGGSVVQATAVDMPVLVQRSPGQDIACVDFDGVSDYLQDTVLSLAQPTHVFLVALPSESDVADSTMLDGHLDLTRRVFTSGTGVGIYAGAFLGKVTDRDVWHRIETLFNSASSRIVIDEGAPATGDAGTGSATGVTLGRRGSAVNHGDCRVSEVIMFDRALNTSEVARIGRYLLDEHGPL